ncbi:hypothetical protein QMG25_20260, partial [Arthrobacter sp. H35-D1]|nr:hypothetical protein [Arthrobacter sp. H35-D1]
LKRACPPALSKLPGSSVPLARRLSNMSEDFRRNLLGPEPTLLRVEAEIYEYLSGQEAQNLATKYSALSLLGVLLAECGFYRDHGPEFVSQKIPHERRTTSSAPSKNSATTST